MKNDVKSNQVMTSPGPCGEGPGDAAIAYFLDISLYTIH